MGALSQFFDDRGTVHQCSYARTPQQNGVPEHKLRHLLEVTQALSFHMHVPKPFWSNVVLTMCYRVNRMPYTVSSGRIPHSVLYTNYLLFSLPPKVFGCTCYVHALVVTNLIPMRSSATF